MLFFGVVSEQTEVAFEFFIERERAEAFIAEVEKDEPETAALLRVEAVGVRLQTRLVITNSAGARLPMSRGKGSPRPLLRGKPRLAPVHFWDAQADAFLRARRIGDPGSR